MFPSLMVLPAGLPWLGILTVAGVEKGLGFWGVTPATLYLYLLSGSAVKSRYELEVEPVFRVRYEKLSLWPGFMGPALLIA